MWKKLVAWFNKLFNEAAPPMVDMTKPVETVKNVVPVDDFGNQVWFQTEGVFPTQPAAPTSNVIPDALDPKNTFAQYIQSYMASPACPGWKHQRITFEMATILFSAATLPGNTWAEKLDAYFDQPTDADMVTPHPPSSGGTTVIPQPVTPPPAQPEWPKLYDGTWFTSQESLDDYKIRVIRRNQNLIRDEQTMLNSVYNGPIPVTSLTDDDKAYLYFQTVARNTNYHSLLLSGTYQDVARAINEGQLLINQGYNVRLYQGQLLRFFL